MKTDGHARLILQTIKDHAAESGIAWWDQVGPALEPFGLDFNNVTPLRDRGLIEQSREIGRLRLTAAGLRLIS